MISKVFSRLITSGKAKCAREISGGTMPYGLQLILGAMGGCIHDEDPISLLDINKNIEEKN